MDGRLKLKDYFNTNHILKETNENELYQSIEELKDAELNDPTETGRINWNIWQKVVEETKEQLSKLIFYDTKTIIQAFDLKGNLINQYNSYKEAAMDWYTTPELVNLYCRRKVPYQKQQVFFKTKNVKVPREKWVKQ